MRFSFGFYFGPLSVVSKPVNHNVLVDCSVRIVYLGVRDEFFGLWSEVPALEGESSVGLYLVSKVVIIKFHTLVNLKIILLPLFFDLSLSWLSSLSFFLSLFFNEFFSCASVLIPRFFLLYISLSGYADGRLP